MSTSTIRRFFLRPSTLLCLSAGIVLGATAMTSTALADIGVSLDKAKALVSDHAAKHRGRYPLFKTDSDGIVVRECWEAPSGGWTKPEAMSLVRDLVPQELKAETPRRAEPQSGGEMLVYPDGTSVWLEFSGARASYRVVAVLAPEYRGPAC